MRCFSMILPTFSLFSLSFVLLIVCATVSDTSICSNVAMTNFKANKKNSPLSTQASKCLYSRNIFGS